MYFIFRYFTNLLLTDNEFKSVKTIQKRLIKKDQNDKEQTQKKYKTEVKEFPMDSKSKRMRQS